MRVAVDVAAAHDVRSSDPLVLAEGFNVVVHLRPAPVVARVVLMPALLRSDLGRMISRELAVTGFLAERGVRAVRPSGELPGGPHERHGLWMSFWEHLDVQPGNAGPSEFGAHLRELHEALRDYPADGEPLDIAFADIEAFLRHGGKYVDVSDEDITLIGVELDRIRCALTDMGPVQQLHGDAHPGNLLRTPQGRVWTDFEESMSGPLGWDLACVSRTTRLDSARAIREYGADPTSFESFRALRALQAACWYLLLEKRVPGYRQRALDVLDRFR